MQSSEEAFSWLSQGSSACESVGDGATWCLSRKEVPYPKEDRCQSVIIAIGFDFCSAHPALIAGTTKRH